jgi:hypothetical protein
MAEIRDLIRILVADATEWALERTGRVDIGSRNDSLLRGRRAQESEAGDMWP